MKRRNFLQHSTLAALAAWLPTTWVSTASTDAHAFAHPDLLHIIGDEKKVQAIGISYRSANPEFNSKQHTLNTLQRTTTPQTIKHRIQQDFAQGNTVQVNGWILSKTEAHQCALYSLINA